MDQASRGGLFKDGLPREQRLSGNRIRFESQRYRAAGGILAGVAADDSVAATIASSGQADECDPRLRRIDRPNL